MLLVCLTRDDDEVGDLLQHLLPLCVSSFKLHRNGVKLVIKFKERYCISPRREQNSKKDAPVYMIEFRTVDTFW